MCEKSQQWFRKLCHLMFFNSKHGHVRENVPLRSERLQLAGFSAIGMATSDRARPDAAAPTPAISALVGALSDGDESVRRAAANSIVKIGASKPEQVLPELLNSCKPSATSKSAAAAASAAASAAADWLTGGSVAQRAAALRVAADVAREAQRQAPSQLPADLLLTAVVEEVDTSVDAEAAAAAGDLLIELARVAPHDAAQMLGNRCRAGTLPSPGVLRGLGELAQASPPVMVPLLKSQLLPRLLPLLGAAKGDARIAFGIALHHFAEAVSAHDSSGVTHEVSAASFASEMQSAIEHLLAQWIPSRSERVRDAAAEALASMVVLLPAGFMRTLAPRLLVGLLAASRREKEDQRLQITAALWAALAHSESCGLGRELHTEGVLSPVLIALHAAVCAPYDRNSPACLKNHNEELRCLEALGVLAFDEVFAYVLAQLDSEIDGATHCGTLEVLRHLVQRLSARFDGRGETVLTALTALLPNATSFKVRVLSRRFSLRLPPPRCSSHPPPPHLHPHPPSHSGPALWRAARRSSRHAPLPPDRRRAASPHVPPAQRRPHTRRLRRKWHRPPPARPIGARQRLRSQGGGIDDP